MANFSKHITFCDTLDPTAPWAMPSCSINRRSSSSCFILSSSLAICTRSPRIAFISSVMLQNGHTSEYTLDDRVTLSDLRLTSPGTTSFQGSSFLREGGGERTRERGCAENFWANLQSREGLTFHQFMPRAKGVEPMKGLGYNLKPHPSPVVNNNYTFL